MKKVFTLLTFFVLTFAGTLQAKDKVKVTTLWEGEYSGGSGGNLEINYSQLVSGATITVTLSVTEGETSNDRKLRIFYTAADDNWSQTSFRDINDWVELSAGTESYSFTLASSAYSILGDNTQSHQILYIGATSSCLTISKITMTETLTPSIGDNLLSPNWSSSKETALIFAAQSGAKIGDVLQFTVTTTEAWKWVQFKLTDKDGNVDVFTEGELQGNNGNTSFTLEFDISTLADLKKIANEGFGVIQTGDNAFTMTAVKLLTYSDSYGYVTVSFGETGLRTWSSDKKYDFARAGITAYYASAVSSGVVTLTPMNITWDYQGYILSGSANQTYEVLESKTTDDDYYPSLNHLKYNITSSEIAASTEGTYHYIFAWDKTNLSSVGFYYLEADHTLAANKAYLETTENYTPQQAQGGAPMLRLDFGEENNTTSVEAIEQTAPCKKWMENGQLYILRDGVTYDIMGRIIK